RPSEPFRTDRANLGYRRLRRRRRRRSGGLQLAGVALRDDADLADRALRIAGRDAGRVRWINGGGDDDDEADWVWHGDDTAKSASNRAPAGSAHAPGL